MFRLTRTFYRFNSSTAPTTVKAIVDATKTSKQVVSGAPEELTYQDKRTAHIYKEAKYATQSASRNSKFWKLEFDILAKGNRWENDLIGYQGSSDYMHCTSLNFNTKEEATRFAQGQGWDFYVTEPKERRFEPKQYSSNFEHVKGPLKIIRCK